jgi:hypothetical protein
MPCIDLSVPIVTKSPKVGPLLIFSISLLWRIQKDKMTHNIYLKYHGSWFHELDFTKEIQMLLSSHGAWKFFAEAKKEIPPFINRKI